MTNVLGPTDLNNKLPIHKFIPQMNINYLLFSASQHTHTFSLMVMCDISSSKMGENKIEERIEEGSIYLRNFNPENWSEIIF